MSGHDDRPPGVAVDIPDDVLGKLTVAEIKAELVGRDVEFPARLLKKELLTLLKDSLDRAVVAFVAKRKNTKEKAIPWNDDHPARKLLHDEFKAGRIPLDHKEMGPAEIYYVYGDSLEFQIKGMEHGDLFRSRLLGLREQISRDKTRAVADKISLKKAIRKHPVPPLNQRGQPQWNGSVAQALPQCDMHLGRHLEMDPSELRMKRFEYQAATSVDQFRWKVQQETRTKKYLCTLKHNAEEKLRANLPKNSQLQ